ncbi:MAG: FAD-dependent oxidoreductase [Candidatus Omnitrophica bacterium]|nr:FAD-dependent oxidoreductase [Candidatus Omnitrophota bacterium]
MINSCKKKIVILGGGLSGISLGYFLNKLGIESVIYEKEPTIGGLCRSKIKNGFIFDICGHLLHFKHKTSLPLIKDLLKDNLVYHKRSSWIYSFNKFTKYPFQANLYGLPNSVIKNSIVDFIKVKIDTEKNSLFNNFLEWSYVNFGKSITDYFMAPYNRKFWTVPLEDLSYKWIDGIVVTPTLKQIVDGTIEENNRNVGYNSFFWYPKEGGIDNLIKAFSQPLKSIFTGYDVEGIDHIKKKITFKNGKKCKYDILISTIPLPELPNIIKNVPLKINKVFKKLQWVSIFNLNLGLTENHRPKKHWIYFPENNLKFFRVGFFNNFSNYNTPIGSSSIYSEVSYSNGRCIDNKKIVSEIFKGLKTVGILNGKSQELARVINDIKYAYPIYNHDYKDSLDIIKKYLSDCNLNSIGRFGGWKYMSMEDVILESERLSSFLLKNV